MNAFITNSKVDVLQPLHQLCFDAAGKPTVMKKNLRKFNGFEFERDSAEFQKKLDAAGKLDIGRLKSWCEVFGVPKKGTKEELAQNVCEFLLAPEGEEEPESEEEEEDEEDKSEEAASSEEERATSKRKGGKAATTPAKNARGRPAKESASRSTAGRPRRSTAGRTRGN